MTNKKPKCDHTIGYVDSNGYDGDTITTFMYLSVNDLSEIKDLKSEKGCLYKFCPHCGKKLDGLLDKRIEQINAQIQAYQEEERIKRDAANAKFLKKVEDLSIQTKLNTLPEDGNFIVLFYPTEGSYNSTPILVGDKQYILRNSVSAGYRKENEEIFVKDVFKICSNEFLFDILAKADLKPELISLPKDKIHQNIKFSATKNNIKYEFCYENGMLYITELSTDSDGDVSKKYDRFALHRLGEFLNIEIPLERITLE